MEINKIYAGGMDNFVKATLSKLKQAIKQINADSTLSVEEKNKAIEKAKTEKKENLKNTTNKLF